MARTIDYGNLMHRAMRGLIQSVLTEVAAHLLPVWIKGSDAHREELCRRFDRAPKPMYYQPAFLHDAWEEYRSTHAVTEDTVDPDAFVRGAGGEDVPVGNCTVPPNQAIPPAGALVEVRYLYVAGAALAQDIDGAVPPFLTVAQVGDTLAHASLVIGLDTGMTHLAAAHGRPTLGIYCDHEPGLAGVTGPGQVISLGGKGQVPSLAAVTQALRTLQPL